MQVVFIFNSNKDNMRKHAQLIILVFIPALCMGQDNDSIQKKLASTVTAIGFSPFASDIQTNFTSSASFSVDGNGIKSAQISLKRQSRDNTWSTGIILEQVVDKKAEEAKLIDLSGLTSGTRLSINFQKTFWSHDLEPNTWNAFDQAKRRMASRKPDLDTINMSFDDVLKDSIEGPVFDVKFKQSYIVNLSMGLRATVNNYTTDSFFVTETTQRHYTPEVTATLILPFAKKLVFNSLLSFSYLYIETYSDQTARTFLTSFGSTGSYESRNIVFGTPKHTYEHLVKAEYRILSQNTSLPLGLAPFLEYGIKNKNLSLVFPVYFLRGTTDDNKPDKLQGGIRFGYTTNVEKRWKSIPEGLTAELVVSQPFSLF
jgi:hypothetical protein